MLYQLSCHVSDTLQRFYVSDLGHFVEDFFDTYPDLRFDDIILDCLNSIQDFEKLQYPLVVLCFPFFVEVGANFSKICCVHR